MRANSASSKSGPVVLFRLDKECPEDLGEFRLLVDARERIEPTCLSPMTGGPTPVDPLDHQPR